MDTRVCRGIRQNYDIRIALASAKVFCTFLRFVHRAVGSHQLASEHSELWGASEKGVVSREWIYNVRGSRDPRSLLESTSLGVFCQIELTPSRTGFLIVSFWVDSELNKPFEST